MDDADRFRCEGVRLALWTQRLTPADTIVIQHLTVGISTPMPFEKLVTDLNLAWLQAKRARTGVSFAITREVTGPCYECQGDHEYKGCPIWKANPNRENHLRLLENKRQEVRKRTAAAVSGTSMAIVTFAAPVTVVLCGVCRQPHPTDDCPFLAQLCRRCGKIGCLGCCPTCAKADCPGC